jgi:hypothetical protein
MARHKFHGDSARFEVVADYVTAHIKAKFVADVAGGQGMLSRLLNKRGYEAEVIDPRGWTMVGVASRQVEYSADMADYYDLVIGLHPDEALRPVVESAKIRPVLVVPCCNFWDRSKKLGRNALLDGIEEYLCANNTQYEKVIFNFKGPQNIGFVTSI